jgi:two-component system sensor histidine kinase MprB
MDVNKKKANESKRRFSLRTRVAMLAAACVAGVVALAALGAYWTVRDNLYQQVDDSLVTRAQAAVKSPPVQSRVEQIPGAFLTSSDVLIGVLSANGYITIPKEGTAPSISKDELAVAQGTKDSSIRTDSASDTRVIALPSGEGQAMVLARSLNSTKQTLNELSVVLFLIGGAGIIVAALAGTVVARGGLRPVERLTSATERIARTGDLQPIPVSGDDELARLTHSFNAMLATVSESRERQRQLVADAGHELRTPLTSLRTNLELLLSAGRAGAPQLSEKDRVEIESDITGQLNWRGRMNHGKPTTKSRCSKWSRGRWIGPDAVLVTFNSKFRFSLGH